MPTWRADAGAGLSEWFGVAELRAVPGQAEQAHRTTESVLHEAGRQSCVVGRGGFAALADHADAPHVRLIAPAQWRIDRVAAERVVTRTEACRLVAANYRMRRGYIGRHYARRLDDPSNFHLMITASRFTDEELVEVIVAGLPAGTASSDGVTAIGAERTRSGEEAGRDAVDHRVDQAALAQVQLEAPEQHAIARGVRTRGAPRGSLTPAARVLLRFEADKRLVGGRHRRPRDRCARIRCMHT